MSRLPLLDQEQEKKSAESPLASTVVGELTDILEKSERQAPAADHGVPHWYYTAPMPGVRCYGFPPRSSPV